ncbi:response regulator [Sphingorhabdus soli]|uniref:Response regulator n=1 Tax=Flavisphingopyxis soli TaxID=2601267 RepID=A0A5C6U9G2_9SPHN|nr:response regulator [Sphingorhabdus soli]TXC68178.1 response regulator [Sphingorhabdus soli]
MPVRVLIVEDECFVAADICETIEDGGYVCAGIADDTASAMQLASPDIDIALVDVNLCDGATGPMIGELLSREYGIKVIFVTANPAQLGGGIPGTLGVVTKPADVRLIDQVLDYALRRDSSPTPTPPPGFVAFAHAA